MSEVEIVHPVDVEEIAGWRSSMTTTFLQDPSPQAQADSVEARRRTWVADRAWGARADGRWVGTLATLDRRMTVPASEMAVDALTAVSVGATHRRRGVLTAMLTDSLRAAAERGDAASILIAAEWPIYGRFGYSPAELSAWYVLDPRRPGATVLAAPAGSLRVVDATEFGTVAPPIFATARAHRAGNIDRPPQWWSRLLGTDGFVTERFNGRVPTRVVYDGSSGPEGFLCWVATREFGLDGTLAAIEVVELCAATDEAYRGLWSYLTGIDLVGELVLKRRPVDEPARWLIGDGRALRQPFVGDGLWLRLLDVPAALAARRYRVPGRLVLQVSDEAPGGWAAGRYLLDGGPDGATCVATSTGTADLRLDQRALASAYLGGFSLAQQGGRAMHDEHRTGAVALFDAMFGTDIAPWCATSF